MVSVIGSCGVALLACDCCGVSIFPDVVSEATNLELLNSLFNRSLGSRHLDQLFGWDIPEFLSILRFSSEPVRV